MYEDIKRILIASFNVLEEDFHDNVTLEELGLDSLDLVELAMQVETFGVKVSDGELAEAERFDAVIDLMESRVTAAG